ncbi:MAG: hypothetical protein P8Z79_00660 [Sedimentisphaerales bacterium]
MVLADGTLFVGGPSIESEQIPKRPADADPFAKALEARRGGSLLVVSADTGKTMADHDLKSPPVFDSSMVAAYGRLYISTEDGSIVCMAGQ